MFINYSLLIYIEYYANLRENLTVTGLVQRKLIVELPVQCMYFIKSYKILRSFGQFLTEGDVYLDSLECSSWFE